MPGWYIHLDVARKAISELPDYFTKHPDEFPPGSGLSLDALQKLAKDNPSYYALGSIGPDFFFFLPDYEPTDGGKRLWGAAHAIKTIYDEIDPFLGTYTDQFTALSENSQDILNNFTGGLSSQLAETVSEFMNVISEAIEIAASTEYDIFGKISTCGVQKGVDEQVFYFSDMLHYRKTYQFAAHLWKQATTQNNPQFQAFALGWMSHLATDVTGHSFVNEKCGGPYRLHWQRHHCVESHMDGLVYVDEYGNNPLYEEISTAALHTWIAFDEQDTPQSYVDFLAPGEHRPNYLPSNDTQGFLSRRSVWDYDSDLPSELADFMVAALKAVYTPDANSAGSNGPESPHPSIINAVHPAHTDPFPDAGDVQTTYWWLYHYLKLTTTDRYRFVRPEPPPVFILDYTNLAASFPAPPGTGSAPTPATTPNSSSPTHNHHLFELAVAIFAWLTYLRQVVLWFISIIPAMILSPLTWPLRELIYEFIELPLYCAQMALHYYLSLLGFTHPFKTEIEKPLTTLGKGWQDIEHIIEGYIGNTLGGLLPSPPAVTTTEPSGSDLDQTYPHDVVTDPPSVASIASLGVIPFGDCTFGGETATEFFRPWRWPDNDQEGDPIPSEMPLTTASPYLSGQDATVLLGNTPGSLAARTAFENAHKESETLTAIHDHLTHNPQGISEHLGDPADYTAYLMTKLTRDGIEPVTLDNFNLDADRGYAYKCWDWKRSHDIKATLKSFQNLSDKRSYRAPLRPGYGWDDKDLNSGQALPPMGDPLRPTMHRPQEINDPVEIRYIDKEPK